jgi:anti-sigma factor RsiW
MKLSTADQLLLQRHLDGELEAAADAAFRARLAAEPELADAATSARALRVGFAAARATTMRPPATFAAAVVAASRRLPTRHMLEQADVTAGAIAMCRRLLLAALVLGALGLLWHSGLVRDESPATMQASPADVQREIERLDAELGAHGGSPGAPAGRSPR